MTRDYMNKRIERARFVLLGCAFETVVSFAFSTKKTLIEKVYRKAANLILIEYYQQNNSWDIFRKNNLAKERKICNFL